MVRASQGVMVFGETINKNLVGIRVALWSLSRMCGATWPFMHGSQEPINVLFRSRSCDSSH